MTKKNTLLILIVLFALSFKCPAQTVGSWTKWSWLTGEWQGEGNGQPGQGSGVFSFKTELDGKILVRRSHSEYPASGNRPATVHDDLMIVSLDSAGSPSKAVYFDNEGHTINYSITYAPDTVVLQSEKIPNLPVFRLTYSRLDDKTVNTKFELSREGQNFVTYVEGKSIRKP